MYQKVFIKALIEEGRKGYEQVWTTLVDQPDGDTAGQAGMQEFLRSELYLKHRPRRYYIALVDATLTEDEIDTVRGEMKRRRDARIEKIDRHRTARLDKRQDSLREKRTSEITQVE